MDDGRWRTKRRREGEIDGGVGGGDCSFSGGPDTRTACKANGRARRACHGAAAAVVRGFAPPCWLLARTPACCALPAPPRTRPSMLPAPARTPPFARRRPPRSDVPCSAPLQPCSGPSTRPQARRRGELWRDAAPRRRPTCQCQRAVSRPWCLWRTAAAACAAPSRLTTPHQPHPPAQPCMRGRSLASGRAGTNQRSPRTAVAAEPAAALPRRWSGRLSAQVPWFAPRGHPPGARPTRRTMTPAMPAPRLADQARRAVRAE